MPLSLYADECVDARVVRGLRRRGIDVLSAADEGLLGASDETHLARATALGRIMMTSDHDFLALVRPVLETGTPFPGLIFILPEAGVGHAVHEIALLAALFDPADMRGSVEWN
jgi:predicted nuclease of predicted toxin-antitoxin system